MGIASGGALLAAGSSAAMALAGEVVLISVQNGSFVVNTVRGTNGLTNKIRKFLKRRNVAKQLTDINNCDHSHSQKEELHEKMWGIVKDFMIEEVFHKKCRISGIPKDHIFQDVFKMFKGKENVGFAWLDLQTANASSQDAAQISFDVNRISSHLFDNMFGLSSN